MGLDQRLSIVHEDAEVWAHNFRKVNFLHRWVTVNLCDGAETNCDDVELNLEQVAGLAQTCEAVIRDPATGPELLPTQEGFFFGDTGYDGYYLADVLDVLDACNHILAHGAVHHAHAHGGDPLKVIYWSWW